MSVQPHKQIQKNVTDEQILVVKRDAIFSQEACWQGLKKIDCDDYMSLIHKEKEFLPRSLMEEDPRYKQIIPYLIFCHNDTYFLMQRKSKASEQRLKNKYSLGIGGHINEQDLTDDSIINWARREFDEEVNYSGSYTVEPLGLLNDDSNDVGKVHMGFVFLLKGDSDAISVKSEHKNGMLLSRDECNAYYDNMESWTQMVFDVLNQK
jgi:predicted NUDIX family phosphoesterase